MKCISLLFFALSLPVFIFSQSPEQPIRPHAGELYQDLKLLTRSAKVMYLAAHPDDENTRVIAYLEKARNVETAYLSLTRGDGGQNLIGSDIGVYLGVLRSRELLNARKRDGGQQYFTRAVDFGYSKNPDETFEHWNRDSVLKDMVYAIRDFRPDVIICRFPPTAEGGHGHHTASAILAEEAFDLSADDSYNTGQKTHDVERLLWNSYSWRRSPEMLKEDVEIHMGEYLPFLGKYVGEIAADARSQHRCQGFGRPLERGDYSEYFKNVKGSPIKKDILEGIDSTWNKYGADKRLQTLLDGVLLNFSFTEPHKSIPALQQIEKILVASPAFEAKQQRLNDLQQLIVKLSGFYAEWTLSEEALRPNKDYQSRIEISCPTEIGSSVTYETPWFKGQEEIKIGERTNVSHDIRISQEAFEQYQSDIPHITPINNDLFTNSSALAAMPENRIKDPFCTFYVNINGITYPYRSYLKRKSIAPEFGEKYNRALVLPTLSFQINQKDYIIKTKEWNVLEIDVVNRGEARELTLNIEANGVEIEKEKTYKFAANKKRKISFNIKAQNGGSYALALSLSDPKTGERFGTNERHVNYEHIPHLVDTEDAKLNIQALQLNKHELRVAYLTGAGDLMPENLRNVGITVNEIPEEALLDFNPDGYDAIVAGIRLYNVSENIGKIQDKLNAYIKKGGTYIVQYNTSNFIGGPNASLAPKELSLGRDRVTIESSPVSVINPEHFVFKQPYELSKNTWNDWVQERGLYFAEKWSEDFSPLLEMADKGEKPSQGSLMYLSYGSGHYYYTGLSFFRNLPAGVEGSYQLFINMLYSSKTNMGDNK